MKEYRSSELVDFKYAKGKTDIYKRMFHDYYEIYLLLGGNVEFTNNHTKRSMAPFQLVLISPGEYHQFVVKKNIDDYERCVMNIEPGFLPSDILKTAFYEKGSIKLSESDRIVKHFMYLINCLSSVDASDFSHILSAVATDIIFLIKNNVEEQEVMKESFNNLPFDLISYIDEHFAEPLDLTVLSNRFFCSVSSLCHIFKNSFGISIKKYMIQKRLFAAKIALQRGEKPEEVSVRSGFSNYSTFYRDYKKHFGISPSETYTHKNTHI